MHRGRRPERYGSPRLGAPVCDGGPERPDIGIRRTLRRLRRTHLWLRAVTAARQPDRGGGRSERALSSRLPAPERLSTRQREHLLLAFAHREKQGHGHASGAQSHGPGPLQLGILARAAALIARFTGATVLR